MTISMSASFRQFEKDFIHANTWPQRKDGVPTFLLDQLSSDEKAIAEDQLIELLSVGDSWPALGLGHLRSQKALPSLYALLEKCRQRMVIFVAYSIYQINKDSRMIDVALDELPKITDEYALLDILYYLGLFNDPRIKVALRKYRNDPRYLVAYNAARALGESTNAVVEEFRKKKQSGWRSFFFGK